MPAQEGFDLVRLRVEKLRQDLRVVTLRFLDLGDEFAAPSAGATMFAFHKEFRVASTIRAKACLGIKFLKL